MVLLLKKSYKCIFCIYDPFILYFTSWGNTKLTKNKEIEVLTKIIKIPDLEKIYSCNFKFKVRLFIYISKIEK